MEDNKNMAPLEYPQEFVEKLRNMTIFWDFHGTLCPLRATESKIFIPEEEYVRYWFRGSYPLDHRMPPQALRRLINKQLDRKKQYVLSSVSTNKETAAELEYIQEWYSGIPEHHVITVAHSSYKRIVLEEYFSCIMKCDGPSGKDFKRLAAETDPRSLICMIDDNIEVLMDCEKAGFSVYHISSLIP